MQRLQLHLKPPRSIRTVAYLRLMGHAIPPYSRFLLCLYKKCGAHLAELQPLRRISGKVAGLKELIVGLNGLSFSQKLITG